MVPRVILKCPDVIEAEKAATEARKKVADKWKVETVEKMKQWEEGKLSEEEWKVYREAASPIKTATMDGGLEKTATGQNIVHTVGMRALQDWWERKQEGQGMVLDSAGKHPGLSSQKAPRQLQQLQPWQQQLWQQQLQQQQQQQNTLVTLGLSRNRSVGRIKGNQATFDNSQRNNLRSSVWFQWVWFGSVVSDVRADFSRFFFFLFIHYPCVRPI